VIAPIHSSACSAGVATGPPSSRPRHASATTVSGLALTTGCSQPGMRAGEAKIELAKISGISATNQTICTASGLRIISAVPALMKANEMPKATTSASPATPPANPPPKRNPTPRPTATISATVSSIRAVSDRIRAMRYPERAIGSDRKRSRMPLRTSVASPAAVIADENATCWTRMPGIR
jgi:hypothetical protein